MRTENIKVVRVNDTWENRLRRLKEIVRREEQIKAVRKLKYYSRKLQQTKCKIPRKLKFLDFPSVAINIHTNPPPRNISHLMINATRHRPFQATQFPRYLDCAQKIRKIQTRSIIVKDRPTPFLVSSSRFLKTRNQGTNYLFVTPFKPGNDEQRVDYTSLI